MSKTVHLFQAMPHLRGWKPRNYDTPEELIDAAIPYLQFCAENPIYGERLFHHQGVIVRGSTTHARIMTVESMLAWICVDPLTWRDWKAPGHRLYRADLMPAIKLLEAAVRDATLGGAAAGLLNPMIAARVLKLRETTVVVSEAEPDRQDRWAEMSEDQIRAELLRRGLPGDILTRHPEAGGDDA